MDQIEVVRVAIGGIEATRSPLHLFTVVGSCVAVMLFDPVAKVGGMVHVMLAHSHGHLDEPGKYADTGIPHLISLMVRTGAAPQRLKGAKIAGGSEMWKIKDQRFNVGSDNITEVVKVLGDHGITVIAADTGGSEGRRVTMRTDTGKVKVESAGKQTIIL